MPTDVDIVVSDTVPPPDHDVWRAVAPADMSVWFSPPLLAAYERKPLLPLEAVRYLTWVTPTRAGIVPAFLVRAQDPLGVVRRLLPDAAGRGRAVLQCHVWHSYDAAFPVVAFDERCARALVARLRTEARRLGAGAVLFTYMPSGSGVAAVLREAGLRSTPTEQRFRADLAGVSDVAQYVRRLSRNQRHNIERTLRRAAEVGARVRCFPATGAALETAARFARASADRHGTHDFYPEEPLSFLGGALGPDAEVVTVADADDRVLASGICLRDRRRYHVWAGGSDRAYRGAFLPSLLWWHACLRRAFDHRVRIVEGGRRSGEFKRRLGMSPLLLETLWSEIE